MMHTIYLYQCLLFQHPKMSEVLYMCVVFGVGTTYGKRRPLKGEREAGVLLLFEEDQEGGLAGVTGLGEGTQHAWESSSVAV